MIQRIKYTNSDFVPVQYSSHYVLVIWSTAGWSTGGLAIRLVAIGVFDGPVEQD